MIYSHKDYEREPFRAVEDLSNYLKRGSLTLFLGAGISKGFGLPSWGELIAHMLGKGDDIDYIDSLKQKSDIDISKLVPFPVIEFRDFS